MLSNDEKQELLRIAREAVSNAVQGKTEFRRKLVKKEYQPSGVFVTLRIEGELRGCIGYIESENPLEDVIAEVAIKAATADPRFTPMTHEEIERASIEISILSPLHRIAGVEEIAIGVHGIVVSVGAHRGLLLPQVAVEHNLDKQAFLEAAMRKTGLPSGIWNLPEVELSVFTAEVFCESEVIAK